MSSTGQSVKASPRKPEDNTFEIIIIAILVIVILIVLTTTLYYLRRSAECYTYPSPWCYSDWICPNLPAEEQNRWNMLKNLKLASVDSTEGLCFLSDGTINPECQNVWAKSNGGFLCGTPNNTVPCSTCQGIGTQNAPCNTPYSSLPEQT